MNKYTELKAKHSKMINDFPIGFAFSDKQLEEAKEKLGVKSNDELLQVHGGGFIRKTDKDWYNGLLIEMTNESNRADNDDEYLYQGFLYELANHEFCITCDPTDTLAVFGWDIDKLDNDERVKRIFKEARTKYLDSCEDWN